MSKLSKKVCLLGDFAVGKTSLVRRFVYDLFEDKYLSTIGVKVSRKAITVEHNDDAIELTMMLWDLAGSEEFDQVRASYLRGAAGAVLVCDLTRFDTLSNLGRYTDIFSQNGPDTKLVLAANKNDLVDRHQLTEAQIADFARAMNIPFFVTSAKTGDTVEQMFQEFGRLLVS